MDTSCLWKMARKFELILAVLAGILAVGLCCSSADYLGAEHEQVPCVEVPACPAVVTVSVDQKSTGEGAAESVMEVDLCHSRKYLEASFRALNDSIIRNDVTDCNGAIFNQAVAELFISPFNEQDPDPHCYYEIDISPHSVMFESSIVNHNLDASDFGGTELDCATSGIRHWAEIDYEGNAWSAKILSPWSLITSPIKCDYPGHTGEMSKVWRFNIYRIRLQQDTSSCNSSKCEYNALNPTDKSPPSFHHPKKFAVMVLQ